MNSLKVTFDLCPACDGIFIEREGPYGKFYGCSNYPNCKMTGRECPNCGQVTWSHFCKKCGCKVFYIYTKPTRYHTDFDGTIDDHTEQWMSWLDCSDFIPDGSD